MACRHCDESTVKMSLMVEVARHLGLTLGRCHNGRRRGALQREPITVWRQLLERARARSMVLASAAANEADEAGSGHGSIGGGQTEYCTSDFSIGAPPKSASVELTCPTHSAYRVVLVPSTTPG